MNDDISTGTATDAADSPAPTRMPDPSVAGPIAGGADRGPHDPCPYVRGYEVVEWLGRGGMGTVWGAVQFGTRRRVALKVLNPALFGSAEARRRFDREVELTARLEHPNIARVYESGLDQGVYFYTMELVQGVDFATTLHILAGVLKTWNSEAANVQRCYRQALEIRRTTLPGDHPDLAQSLRAAAEAELPPRQEEMYRQALAIQRKALSPAHPEVARTLNSLGLCLHVQSKYAEAGQNFAEALRIRRKLFDAHPDIADTLAAAASTAEATGNLEQAEAMLREALEVRRKSQGPSHMEVGWALYRLGTFLERRERVAEAEECYRERFEVCLHRGPAHALTTDSLRQLVRVLKARGKREEALNFARRLAPLERGGELAALGYAAEAEAAYRQAIAVQLRQRDPQKWWVANRACMEIAELLRDQRRFSEAEALWRDTIEAQRTALPAEHSDIMNTRYGVTEVLLKQGRLAEAHAIQQQILADTRQKPRRP
jgi:tetratricopeptide (TPR) repeat protein